MSDFVEVVLVELPDEACEVAVLEMLREYSLCEFFVLRWNARVSTLVIRKRVIDNGWTAYLENDETIAVTAPPDYRTVCRVFKHPVDGASAPRILDERDIKQDLLVQFSNLVLC